MIVYLETDRGEGSNISPPVYTRLFADKLGNFIPRFVLTDPECRDDWGGAAYHQFRGKGATKTFRALKVAVEEKLDGWKNAGRSSKNPEGELLWPTANKRHYRGEFVRVKGDKLVLKVKGKDAHIPMEKLSERSKAFAGELSGVGAKKAKVEFEDWVSGDGKTVKAKFVKLDGDDLTVESEDGKVFTFPLSRLSDASRGRAKKLAGGK